MLPMRGMELAKSSLETSLYLRNTTNQTLVNNAVTYVNFNLSTLNTGNLWDTQQSNTIRFNRTGRYFVSFSGRIAGTITANIIAVFIWKNNNTNIGVSSIKPSSQSEITMKLFEPFIFNSGDFIQIGFYIENSSIGNLTLEQSTTLEEFKTALSIYSF
jgi:hypothetical protein